MYEIRGLRFSFNTSKVIYVAEALGVDYTYTELSLQKGENKHPDHMARHPLGKLPTLTHDGRHLFESGAICKYLASVAGSDLYPISDHYQRCLIDQWIDFSSIHLGRWLGVILWERVLRAKFGLGEIQQDQLDEGLKYAAQQLAAVDAQLGKTTFLAGDSMTIADLFAFAYIESTELSGVSLDPYPNLNAWYQKTKATASIQRAQAGTLMRGA